MNLKSLLIGSAATIVAAPAFAADVIIAEPEPVEYVEVCDVAGAGYFYIPGSRTCIQIGGLVRHELQFSDSDDDFDGEDDGIDSLVRAELTVRTFTETELGDLTSYIRFRANDVNSGPFTVVLNEETGEQNSLGASVNGSTFLNDATIGLGGLLLGMTDTLYDGGINGEFDSFGGNRVHFISYTADLGAFAASVSLESERSFDARFDYVPNVVGKLSGDVGPFSADLWVAYDDEDEVDGVGQDIARLDVNGAAVLDADGNPIFDRTIGTRVTGDDAIAVKLRLGADFGPAAVQIAGTYNSDANYYDNGYEYSAGASAKFGLGEKASLTFGGQYFFNQLTSVNVLDDDGFIVGVDGDTNNDVDAFSVGANIDYEIVDGFDVKVAVNYAETVNDGDELEDLDDGTISGFIRFDRSF